MTVRDLPTPPVGTPTVWKNRIVESGFENPEQLLANPLNWRVHPKNQQDALEAVLDEVGYVDRVLVNRTTGFVVDGHLRVAVGISRRETAIPVDYLDLTEQEEALILATFDAITGMAGADKEKLKELLAQTQPNTHSVKSLLENLAETHGIKVTEQQEAHAPDAQIDKADELREKWQTERGQLWTIGKHRLLCGDSTNADDVARVMGGEKADMVFADPPYGMNLDTDFDSMFQNDTSHRKTGERFTAVLGDDVDYDPRPVMAMFENIAEQFWWGADYYLDKIPEVSSGVFMIWDKRCSDEMDKVVGNVYEMAWSKQKHKKMIARILWSGHHGMQSDDTKTRVHPTQKPTVLVSWFFGKWGKRGDIVVDPYCGSGTTLVACQQTGRIGRGIEIDPRYVAVTLQRLADMGLTPTLSTK